MSINRTLGVAVTAFAASALFGAAHAAVVPIVNGDFEAGVSGFETDYTQQLSLVSPGVFDVTSTPPATWLANYSPNFVGDGASLVVNSATTSGVEFWRQAVNLVAGVEYTFTGSVADLTFAPPVLELFVNGASAGTFSATDGAGEWETFSFAVFGNLTGSVVLALVNNNTVYGGADFAIDNLSLSFEDALETPLPGALPLMVSGLALAFAARRRRKAAA